MRTQNKVVKKMNFWEKFIFSWQSLRSHGLSFSLLVLFLAQLALHLLYNVPYGEQGFAYENPGPSLHSELRLGMTDHTRSSRVGHKAESAYERWTWGRCSPQILTLKRRLGFGERLWILGFELLDDGRLIDVFLDKEVFDPKIAIPATRIPALYSAVPEMYCILSTYATAQELGLSGEQVSLASINRVMGWELANEDCTALLDYSEQDFNILQKPGAPFFGTRLEQGDLAFEVWPLPRVPITLRLWRGDEELPASGALLFDRSVSHYLGGLVVELAWLTVWRLRNILDPGIKWGYHQLARKTESS